MSYRLKNDPSTAVYHSAGSYGSAPGDVSQTKEPGSLEKQRPVPRADGFCLFTIPASAAEKAPLSAVLRCLERFAWEILHVERSTMNSQVSGALQTARWLGASEAASKDAEIVLIAAVNLNPCPASPQWRRLAPGLRDRSIVALTQGRYRLKYPFVNLMRVTTNPAEAWHCIDALLPHESARIQGKIAELNGSFDTPEPVLRRLSVKGGRGKVELIRYAADLAVRKTWRPSQRSCWAREVHARTALVGVPSIPPILASGENWIIIPYYEDQLRWQPYRRGLLPLDHAREIFRNLRQIHDAGYYLLDFLPWNVIVDRAEGVKFVDLEFLYPYERSPESFETSFSLRGVPRGFPQDIPFGPRDVYAEVWQPSIGLTLQSLLEDPNTIQRLKRILHRTRGALRSFSGKAGTRPESADG